VKLLHAALDFRVSIIRRLDDHQRFTVTLDLAFPPIDRFNQRNYVDARSQPLGDERVS